MTKYSVTNPLRAPRVLYDVEGHAKFIPPGETRTVDLHDHDVERLRGAAKGTDVVLAAMEEAPVTKASAKK